MVWQLNKRLPLENFMTENGDTMLCSLDQNNYMYAMTTDNVNKTNLWRV